MVAGRRVLDTAGNFSIFQKEIMAQVVNEPDLSATYGIQPYTFEPDSEPELETEDEQQSMEGRLHQHVSEW